MCSIVLSIKPEFAKKILDGEKKYEFRRIVAREQVDRIYIYETSPVMSVTGEVEVRGLVSDSPEALWSMAKNDAGISEEFYFSYFKGLNQANAYQLGDCKKYEVHKELSDFGVDCAPQSFCYVGSWRSNDFNSEERK